MYQIAAYIHLLAAMTWIGGMLFIVFVLVPLTRASSRNDPRGASRLLTSAVRRFRVVGWIALLVLIGSGIWLLRERGISINDVFHAQGFFYETLRLKIALVGVMLILSGFHDFLLGPALVARIQRLGAAATTDADVRRQRRLIAWTARVNLLVALAIVACGVVLVRGNPF